MNTFYNLNDRALLGLEGKDTFEFLQSVITNDMRKIEAEQAIYAAHLTPKGKFLYDFFVAKMGNLYVLDCNAEELMPIAKALHSYVVNKDVTFHDLRGDYIALASENSLEDSTLSYRDPRHAKLGYRNWLTTLPQATKTLEDYTQKRLELGVLDGAYDGLKERSLINEMGFEALHGVSFNKGCYVGQELTARTKFRTEPKKKVYLVKTQESAPLGSLIHCNKMEAGWLFSNQNGKGLAILRTRYLGKELTLNGRIVEVIAPAPL